MDTNENENTGAVDTGAEQQQIDNTPAPDNSGGDVNNTADSGKPPKEKSVREELTEALKQSKEKANENPDAAKPAQKPPAAQDKTKPAAAATGQQAQGDQTNAGAVKAPEAPKAWPAHMRPKFAALPPDVQKYISEREDAVAKTVAAQDEDRTRGKAMKEVFTPYMQILHAENTTPEKAVQVLLNSAYICRRGTPAQKTALLLQTAKDFNIQLPGFNAPPATGANGQPNPQFQQQQYIASLEHKISTFEKRLNDRDTSEKERETSTINGEIQAFASDPKHPHFEIVLDTMTGLLQSGAAKDMEDAYTQAVWARPELRESLLQEQITARETQRKQASQDRVNAAKKAGSSLSGAPRKQLPAQEKDRANTSTRQDIVDAIAEVRGGGEA